MAVVKEILIDPIINYGPGICTECGSPLIVLDSEMTAMELDQDGNPISEETHIRVVGACTHCGMKYPMMRYKGSYIPCNEASRIIRRGDLIAERREMLANSKKASEKNPLAE